MSSGAYLSPTGHGPIVSEDPPSPTSNRDTPSPVFPPFSQLPYRSNSGESFQNGSEPPSPGEGIPTHTKTHPYFDPVEEREMQTQDVKYFSHQTHSNIAAADPPIQISRPDDPTALGQSQEASMATASGFGMMKANGAEGSTSKKGAQQHGPKDRDGQVGKAAIAGDTHLSNHYESFKATQPSDRLAAEVSSLYTSFQSCVNLRRKYMSLSNQRVQDNPRNYDGRFISPDKPPLDPNPEADKDSDEEEREDRTVKNADSSTSAVVDDEDESVKPKPKFAPWQIYPPPPKPHWEYRLDPFAPAPPKSSSQQWPANKEEFIFENCEIPGPQQETEDNKGKGKKKWEMDESGVVQVFYEVPNDETTANGAPSSSTSSPSPSIKRVPIVRVPTIKEHFLDLEFVLSVISDGPSKSFAFKRIRYLESKWNMYTLLNEYQELADMKRISHRDFYNVRKVDTHIHHSASMNQKHLLRFIKSKMKRAPDDVVIIRDERELTLRQVFERLNLTAYDLSIDTLDMHAHQDSFHRFDKFNLKYNPIGQSSLRDIFLKTDNYIKGRYLAEITQELFHDLEQSKYQMAEYRVSIYGRSRGEWDKLSKWVIHNKLVSDNVRWFIQIPRLYDVFKGNGTVNSFEDVLHNIFDPLFEVTENPQSHPELHVFLQRIVGFDCVDDESKPERRIYRKYPLPSQWNTKQNPPYSYWLYYLYANMTSLNAWRCERGFSALSLRPHAGEAGDPDHLASAFLTSHSISHGILLRKVPALQYLFYLEQIGIAMSPLSNNALFLSYDRNPFPNFFKAGMNVSLSTDDPLQFHFTKEPLLEEYSVAAQIYRFSPADMCELARNSVLQSGFEMEVKRHWLGDSFYLPGLAGNSIHKTNVPNMRVQFRHETLEMERAMLDMFSGKNEVDGTTSGSKLEAGILKSDSHVAAAAMGIATGDAHHMIPGISIIARRDSSSQSQTQTQNSKSQPSQVGSS